MKDTYEVIRKKKTPVTWTRMIWLSKNISRHAFLFGLWINRGLKTLRKLKDWKVVQSETYVLCWIQPEMEEHLFYGCRYSHQVWVELEKRASYSHDILQPWDMEIQWLVHKTKGEGVQQ